MSNFDFQSSWVHIKPVVNTILIDAMMSLFAENSDVKEKFYNFKNLAIEDLNKKRGKFLFLTESPCLI